MVKRSSGFILSISLLLGILMTSSLGYAQEKETIIQFKINEIEAQNRRQVSKHIVELIECLSGEEMKIKEEIVFLDTQDPWVQKVYTAGMMEDFPVAVLNNGAVLTFPNTEVTSSEKALLLLKALNFLDSDEDLWITTGKEEKTHLYDWLRQKQGIHWKKDPADFWEFLQAKEIKLIKMEPRIQKDLQGFRFIVNRDHPLDQSYRPKNLQQPETPWVFQNESSYLRQEAAEALDKMTEAALEATGTQLYLRSGYRSYETQQYLFNSRASQRGEAAANRSTARPGQSEHQTGLAADLTSPKVNRQINQRFGETKEGQWLKDHAHEYGFILRYPLGKESITGYIYEPWHFRYLGNNLAQRLYETGMTMEEYWEYQEKQESK